MCRLRGRGACPPRKSHEEFEEENGALPFLITQLSMNKGKLAATNHICSFICENSLPSDCDLFYIFIVKFLHHYVYFDVLMKCCERLFRTLAHDPLHCKTIVSWAFTTFQLIMVSLKW